MRKTAPAVALAFLMTSPGNAFADQQTENFSVTCARYDSGFGHVGTFKDTAGVDELVLTAHEHGSKVEVTKADMNPAAALQIIKSFCAGEKDFTEAQARTQVSKKTTDADRVTAQNLYSTLRPVQVSDAEVEPIF
jgi:hypothetical protein